MKCGARATKTLAPLEKLINGRPMLVFSLSLHSIQVLFSIRSAFKTAAPSSDYYILLVVAVPSLTQKFFAPSVTGYSFFSIDHSKKRCSRNDDCVVLLCKSFRSNGTKRW